MDTYQKIDLKEQWPEIRKVFRDSFASSFHYAIASINSNNTPHVSPIGSLILDKHEPKGFYFDLFASALRKNLESNPNVCVLATKSGMAFWITSLVKGKFGSPPAIRLYGKVGERRRAAPEEIRCWEKRIGFLRKFK